MQAPWVGPAEGRPAGVARPEDHSHDRTPRAARGDAPRRSSVDRDLTSGGEADLAITVDRRGLEMDLEARERRQGRDEERDGALAGDGADSARDEIEGRREEHRVRTHLDGTAAVQ